MDYVDGTISVEWSKVARVESSQRFVVQTAGGAVYTGVIKAAETPAGAPVRFEIAEVAKKGVALERSKVVEVSQISDSLWQRFSGKLTSGLIFSRGNETAQYNLSSQVAYRRPLWEVQANFSSALSASGGDSTSTRHQLTFSGLRLLQRSNWFYSGLGSFLQRSQQGIQLQQTLGGGIGRFLTNTNRARVSLMAGLAWQGTTYDPSINSVGKQNLASGLIGGNVQVFQFKKTRLDLTATLLPAISQQRGRVRFSTDGTYSVKIIGDLWWTVSV